ncbi:MAG: hypothetical protein IPK50_10730 [Fibrobacterota bacterium]|nr:hypothetical protein [Fibrobacterota bacterium]QQS07351.1 MAG: hypothetical protein IPK50_10730 [Fibrobacterota bacterium]
MDRSPLAAIQFPQKRHAFLIAAHTDAPMARRLQRALRHDRVDIFLHVDRKADPEPFFEPGTIPVHRRIAVRWGGWDLVEATLELLSHSFLHGGYSHFTHLSGQDYLLQPIDRILDELESHQGQWVDLAWTDLDRRSRWSIYHVTAKNLLHRTIQRAYRKFCLRPPRLRPLPSGLVYGCGSALWTLDRQAVEWTLGFLRRRPDVPRFFRNTIHTSEMFVHTLMRSSPFSDQLGRHGHFIDWSRGGPHPEVLVGSDFDRLVRSDMLFARKFESGSSRSLLDALDLRSGLGGTPI